MHSLRWISQLTVPNEQVHSPFWHTWRELHSCVQLPQRWKSDMISLQRPLQHASVLLQVFPQLPQFVLSLR
jgi:hypothetical protein